MATTISSIAKPTRPMRLRRSRRQNSRRLLRIAGTVGAVGCEMIVAMAYPKLKIENEELRKADTTWFLNFQFSILNFYTALTRGSRYAYNRSTARFASTTL